MVLDSPGSPVSEFRDNQKDFCSQIRLQYLVTDSMILGTVYK